MVIREGEVSREMYFIKSGAAQAGTLLAGPAGQTLTFNVFSAMNLLRLSMHSNIVHSHSY
jgi:hypothetical protein